VAWSPCTALLVPPTLIAGLLHHWNNDWGGQRLTINNGRLAFCVCMVMVVAQPISVLYFDICVENMTS
jgi:hypothetical protein